MGTRLVDLPFEVLEIVASSQPLQIRDRVFMFATCRRLRALERAAPALLSDVRGVALASPLQAARLARWLHERRSSVRQLQATLRFDDKLGASLPLLADKLAGGPLAALEWRGRGDLELGAWAAALPALERAVVAAEEGRAALRAPLAGATSLRYLRVSGSRGVEMDADCLPPALEEADIQQPPTTALRPLAAGCAGTLRRLSLARCRAALDCAHLARLTSLTSLALSGCHLSFVPAQLAALTQLEELSLATNRLEGEGWAHLLPLRRLSRLDLRHQLGNRRLQLHPGLLALPSLQELLLADNPFTPSLPVPVTAPTLRTLSLDFEVAARSHAALSRLPALRQLWFVSAIGQVGVAGPVADDATALVTVLSRVPGLRVRWWDAASGRAEFDLSEPLQLAGLALRLALRYPALLGMRLG